MTRQLPESHPVQYTKVSLIFDMIKRNERCHSKYCFDYLCNWTQMRRTSTKPASGSLDRFVHVRSCPVKPRKSHFASCTALRAGLGWQRHKRKFTSKLRQNYKAPAHLYPHTLCWLLLHSSAQPGLCQSTKTATWRRLRKKPLALCQITNTPGPAHRPNLCWKKNKALRLLVLTILWDVSYLNKSTCCRQHWWRLQLTPFSKNLW